MRGNGILMTHNGTGGSGTLTLVPVSGWPSVTDVFGTSGTRILEMEINEYTNSNYTTLSQQETGLWSVNLSTLVATRTKVLSTWNGTTYLPNPGSASAPSALTIGNTAANVRIVCALSAAGILPPIPFVATTIGDGNGTGPLNLVGGSSTTTGALTSGTIYYTPILLGHHGPLSYFATRLTTALTGGTPTIDVSLYEVGSDGLAGARLISFTQTSLPSSAGNVTSSAIATPVEIVPGWYWQAVLIVANSGTGSAQLRGASILSASPLGATMGNSSPVSGQLTGATSQTALPSTGSVTGVVNTQNAPFFTFK